MKPRLIIGLGNTLAGDDGIGCHLVQRLAGDPRLPEDVDLLFGGTDLLRQADALERRRQVLLLDAVLDGQPPGTVAFHHGGSFGELVPREHAHHLSAIQALAVLRAVRGPSHCPHVVLMTISISSIRISPQLSPKLAQRVPEFVDRILHELAGDEMLAG